MIVNWRQFVMNLDSLDPDRVAAALLERGALSVTFTDAGDDPVLEPAPGETPLWADTRITALFDASADLEELPAQLCTSLDVGELPANHVGKLADRPWEREWLRDFGPMRFGRRLWVAPGDSVELPADSVVIRLDPGLAFGTGTHQTTALCLEWLDGADLAGKIVLDFGCGSGILGIAALMLGASEVEAFDIDSQAVTATRKNAERNGVDERLRVGTTITATAGKFDIVVANILSGTLIENADLICNACKSGGRIALSGILAGQADVVQEAFRDRVDVEAPVMLDEWLLLTGTRN